ncbi:Sulfate permease family [Popillia japonica]|uniref:Sulfate permease family n=1 Tax=Popillia japonica TaxID=7064 RepID=A0AAW1ITV7_POPJA
MSSEEHLTDVPSRKTFKSINYKKLLRKRLPILQWLPEYTVTKCLQDALAGFSVGLTEVPQGIAYAVVAGLEPQYGLYSAFLGCFLYTLFGSCKDVNIGPTAIMAMMIQPHVEKFGADGAILLSFITGCIVFILGVLNLGFVVQFFSYPVIAGFTSAAAVQIASTQLSSLFGTGLKSNEFIDAVVTLFENLDKITLWDTLLGGRIEIK